jgi:hypothetical protein
VKIWTTLITVGAMLALAVPVANAQLGKMPGDEGKSGSRVVGPLQPFSTAVGGNQLTTLRLQLKVAKQHIAQLNGLLRVAKGGTAKARAELDATRSLIWGLQAEIRRLQNIIDPPKPAPPRDTRLEDCQSYMVDCTDDELCTYWGSNCSRVADTIAPPVAETPSPQEAPAVSAGSENGSSTAEPQSASSNSAVPVSTGDPDMDQLVWG